MREIGMVRNVDKLGRVVIPVETRRMLGIALGDAIETFVEGGRIIMLPYHEGCFFCDEPAEDMIWHNMRPVCDNCLAKLNELAAI